MALINDFMSLIYPRHCEACGTNLLKHEEFISASINELYAVCVTEKDFTTANYLQWYINDQVEEENTLVRASLGRRTNSFNKVFCFFGLVTIPYQHVLREPQVSPEYGKCKHEFSQIV